MFIKLLLQQLIVILWMVLVSNSAFSQNLDANYAANDAVDRTSHSEHFKNNQANNAIYIQQIGIKNSIYSTTISEESNIGIRQQGDRNFISLSENAMRITKNIVQQGDQNTAVDFNYDRNTISKLELLQDGNNLYFERFGINSLTKSIKFTMKGNSKTILVRSY